MVLMVVILFIAVFVVANIFIKREDRLETEMRISDKSRIFINPSDPFIEVGENEKKLYHPSHSWVLADKDFVYVGFDDFTANLFSPNVNIKQIPELGANIEQGSEIWEIGQGNRTFKQTSPISGKVVSINSGLYNDTIPAKKGSKSWMLKIKPSNLKRDFQNLFSSSKASIINEKVFENLLGDLVGAYQNDGGELADNFIENVSDEDWEIIKKRYLN